MRKLVTKNFKSMLFVMFVLLSIFVFSDDYHDLDYAINNPDANGVAQLDNRTYTIYKPLVIEDGVIIKGPANIYQKTEKMPIFKIVHSNVTIESMNLYGTGFSHYGKPDSCAIYADGGGTYLNNINIYECLISNWQYCGIQFKYVKSFKILRNSISNISFAGIHLGSCKNGLVKKNKVSNVMCVDTPWCGYGIAATRWSANDDISRDINIFSNTVSKVKLYEGIDTHGGYNIRIERNTVKWCQTGIAAVEAHRIAPKLCRIWKNTINHPLRNGSALAGIKLCGYNGIKHGGGPKDYATGTIELNTIYRHGKENVYYEGAIRIFYTHNASVINNKIYYPGAVGICISTANIGNFLVETNTIIEPWSKSYSTPTGILVLGKENTNGRIRQNTIKGGNVRIDKTYHISRDGYGIHDLNPNINNITLGTYICEDVWECINPNPWY